MGFFDRIFGSGEPDPEREPTSPLTFEEWARLKGYPEGMEPPVADGHGNLSFGMAAKVAVKAERHADNAMKRTGLPDQTSGAILSHKQLHDLWHKMPDSSFKYDKWGQIYSLTKHGNSMATLLRFAAKRKPTLLLIKTSKGEVLGALAGQPWEPQGEEFSYYGRGESTAVFRSMHDSNCQWHGWTRDNSMFQQCSKTSLALGGRTNCSAEGESPATAIGLLDCSCSFLSPSAAPSQQSGYALRLDNLRSGCSSPSDTFGNLGNLLDGGSTEAAFEVENVQLWGFGSDAQLHEE